MTSKHAAINDTALKQVSYDVFALQEAKTNLMESSIDGPGAGTMRMK